MPIRWKTEKSGYRPEVVLSRLRQARKVEPDGRLSFTDLRVAQYVAILTSMLDLGGLSDADAHSLVSRSIFGAARAEPYDCDSVLKEVNSQLAKYQKQPEVPYHLITSISARWSLWPKDFRIGAATITVGGRSSSYQNVRPKILQNAKHLFLTDLPTDYIPVLVCVTGRSPEAAAEAALNAVELLRATWNYMLNRDQSMRWSTGLRQPVNRVLLGPIHTLHNADGSSAYDDGWWYEQQYSGAARLFDLRDCGEKMIKFQRRVARLLDKHPYRDLLEGCLVRYSRALDLRDWESSYMQLWAVLEQVTNTGPEGYGVTVRRASFLYKDGEYARQELLHLRDRRNRAVHEGKEHRDLETLLYQLKAHVENLFWFHLHNGRRFRNVQDATLFMDLSSDRAELARQRRSISFALSFRSDDHLKALGRVPPKPSASKR